MVPTLSWMASRLASGNQSWPELSGELSYTDASEHTLLVARWRWLESPPVGGTSCPLHWW
jgi:hypothetical protein